MGAASTTTEELNGGGSPPLCAATRELVDRACLDRRRFIPCQHEQATAGSTGLETRRGAKLGGGVGLSRRGDLAKPRSMLAAKTLLDPLRRELEVGSAAATKLNVHMLPCPVVRARRERRRWGLEKGEASAATGKGDREGEEDMGEERETAESEMSLMSRPAAKVDPEPRWCAATIPPPLDSTMPPSSTAAPTRIGGS